VPYEKLDHATLVEVVRAWAEFRLNPGSLRDLAEEADVSKSAVDNFVKGDSPEKIWPKLRAWFLRDRRARYGSLQDPPAMALLVLETLAAIPAARRTAALVSIIDAFEAVHRDAYAPIPEWVDELRGLAAREGAVFPPVAPVEYPRVRRTKDRDR
jgi:hypothetical protein